MPFQRLSLSLSDLLLELLRPVEALVSQPLAAMHRLAIGAGVAPAPAWLLALVALVVVVRLALLPLLVRQVRLAHASARARPAIEEITSRYAGRTDPAARLAMSAELRSARQEHGASMGCLPALVQGVVLFGLYRLLVDLAAGVPVGAVDAALLASARGADLGGVALPTMLGSLGLSVAGLAVAGLALVAAGAGYATTRWLTVRNVPELVGEDPAAQAHRLSLRLLPWLAAVGLLASAPFVPAGVLLYWAASSLWTVAQQGAVVRWAPTPGTAAYRAKAARAARRG